MEYNFYNLGSKNSFIESQLPQIDLNEKVNDKLVRVDVASIEDKAGNIYNSIIINYDGFVILSDYLNTGLIYLVNNKKYAGMEKDGYIYLGILIEDS